ncbi:hypothetical protein K474DRAFT_1016635 [Panus rudis PR-1116 ss-1]|nr:hypothetical protein K474DRAFT_1016635 [Panus rudis PR-1116 ss-1]
MNSAYSSTLKTKMNIPVDRELHNPILQDPSPQTYLEKGRKSLKDGMEVLERLRRDNLLTDPQFNEMVSLLRDSHGRIAKKGDLLERDIDKLEGSRNSIWWCFRDFDTELDKLCDEASELEASAIKFKDKALRTSKMITKANNEAACEIAPGEQSPASRPGICEPPPPYTVTTPSESKEDIAPPGSQDRTVADAPEVPSIIVSDGSGTPVLVDSWDDPWRNE